VSANARSGNRRCGGKLRRRSGTAASSGPVNEDAFTMGTVVPINSTIVAGAHVPAVTRGYRVHLNSAKITSGEGPTQEVIG
jgi:hypothetical protein